MEGLLFYWVCWSYWIYLTFIVRKQNPYRLKLAALVLIVIILSNIHFSIGQFEFYASGLFLLVISFALIGREKLRAVIYYLICSLIVMISYVTFHLFEIFDPIWVVFSKQWMMAICLTVLALLLQSNLMGRLIIVVSGTIQGEILYAYILSRYPFPYAIASPEYFDVCTLISALLAGWSCLENAGPFFSAYFNLTGKAKQKSS